MQRILLLVLTFIMVGRAMTLAFLPRVGGVSVGDPPAAWLMPLLGDALIGLSALVIGFVLFRKSGLWVWTFLIAWNVVGIWDALSAYLIYVSNPWPEFFMLKLFGPSMFFTASALHVLILILANQRPLKNQILGQANQAI